MFVRVSVTSAEIICGSGDMAFPWVGLSCCFPGWGHVEPHNFGPQGWYYDQEHGHMVVQSSWWHACHEQPEGQFLKPQAWLYCFFTGGVLVGVSSQAPDDRWRMLGLPGGKSARIGSWGCFSGLECGVQGFLASLGVCLLRVAQEAVSQAKEVEA